MKNLPYFRWFTARAKADEKYASMPDRELGFFHRCLNHAWDNDGLPADPDQLARAMRCSRRYLDSVWATVGKCWYQDGDRLRNKTQEEERAHATEKSVKATDAIRTRYQNRTDVPTDVPTNVVPRARARADSLSSSDSKEKNYNLREMPKTDFQARYESLYVSHPTPGFKAEGLRRYLEIIAESVDPERIADVIDRDHAAWVAFWAENPAEYKPGIGKYFEEGWYMRKPVKARDSPAPGPRGIDRAKEASRKRAEEMARDGIRV